MKFTTNYNFNLPDKADQYNLEHWNENTNKVDEMFKEHFETDENLQSQITENKTDIETEVNERVNQCENLQSQIDSINNAWMGELLYSISDNSKSQKTATYTTTEKSMIVCSIGGGGADTGEYFARVTMGNISICSAWTKNGDIGVGNSIIVPKGVTLTFSVMGSTARKANIEVYKLNS